MGEDQSQIETEPFHYGLADCDGSPERIVRPPHEGITIHDMGVGSYISKKYFHTPTR